MKFLFRHHKAIQFRLICFSIVRYIYIYMPMSKTCVGFVSKNVGLFGREKRESQEGIGENVRHQGKLIKLVELKELS